MQPVDHGIFLFAVTDEAQRLEVDTPCSQIDIRALRDNDNLMYWGVNPDTRVAQTRGMGADHISGPIGSTGGGMDLAKGEPYSILCRHTGQPWFAGVAGEGFRYVVYK